MKTTRADRAAQIEDRLDQYIPPSLSDPFFTNLGPRLAVNTPSPYVGFESTKKLRGIPSWAHDIRCVLVIRLLRR